MQRTSVTLEDLPDEVAPTTHLRAEAGVVITVILVFF
jgi:hypothetical protein